MRHAEMAASPAPPVPETAPSTVVISNDGDILIQIENPTSDRCYRCSRNVLRSVSEYFNVLLDPAKFSEGNAIEARLRDLTRQYTDSAAMPASELPKAIIDVGDLPKRCVSTGTASMVITLFFKILHDSSTTWPVPRAESINLVALLSIVADRFACLHAIAEYLIRQRLRITLLKDKRSGTAHRHELRNRQKLLAGLYFGFSEWVYQCSAALIVEGPTRQTTISLDSSEDEDREGDRAVWWRLPGGVEGVFLRSLV